MKTGIDLGEPLPGSFGLKTPLTLLVALVVILSVLVSPIAHSADQAEITFWESVNDSNDPAELEAYLEAYPDGKFAALARLRLKKLAPRQSAANATNAARTETPSAVPMPNEPTDDGPTLKKKSVKIALGALKNNPSKARIGIHIQTVPKLLLKELKVPVKGGVVIMEVVKGYPGHDAGLLASQVITEIDGVAMYELDDVTNYVAKRSPGDEIVATVYEPEPSPLQFIKRVERVLAETNSPEIATALASYFKSGPPFPKDLIKSIHYYERAAKFGSAEAAYTLGTIYSSGRDGVEKNPQTALAWYRKAADAGESRAYDEAARIIYYRSSGDEQANKREALQLYRKGAEAGDTDAMTSAGYMLVFDKGDWRDERLGVRWLRKAADRRSVLATYYLGLVYLWDRGAIKKDRSQARTWFARALEAGDNDALFYLAMIDDEGGDGVTRNFDTAAAQLLKSYTRDDDRARKALFSHSGSWNRNTRKEIQRRLKDAGVYAGAIDGDIGPGTQKALTAYKDLKAKKKTVPADTPGIEEALPQESVSELEKLE